MTKNVGPRRSGNRAAPEEPNTQPNDSRAPVVLQAAESYARLGWPVHPLHPRDKRPSLKDWPIVASVDPATLREWWTKSPNANIGVVTGSKSGLIVIDVDGEAGEFAFAELVTRLGTLPPTCEQRTGKGRQLFFKYPSGRTIRNAAGVAGNVGVDVRGDSGYAVVPPSIHPNGKTYEWELSSDPTNGCQLAELPSAWVDFLQTRPAPTAPVDRFDPAIARDGERNHTLCRLAGVMRARGFSGASIAAALGAENSVRCVPPLPPDEVRRIADSVSRYPPGTTRRNGRSWPSAPSEKAFYGVAGELVRRIEPHTEADPTALLISILVGFGNAIGRSAYFLADGARHFLNLFAVLIGETSKGRKGTAWAQARMRLAAVEPTWAEERVTGGLSSGEGLIWQVRDRIVTMRPVRKKGKPTVMVEEVVDAGVSDKRLMLIESEFANVLRVVQREGNTLSPIVRQAWESGALRSLTKNSPARVLGAHVSILGHVTAEELRRYLDRTEAANGFGNRFLWVCVRRSKCLSEGGQLEEEAFAKLTPRLADAITFAGEERVLVRDEKAKRLWADVYPELSAGKPGLVGSLTSRAEAQVMRLAAIYAILDLSAVIRSEHLTAALALWEFCDASATWCFGDAMGDSTADTILDSLRKVGNVGLTRTDISKLFGRHVAADCVSGALALLVERGLAYPIREDTGGRDAERWRASVDDLAAKEAKNAKEGAE